MKIKSSKDYLVPTKASLFGLDVRFREIDKKIADENEKRNASKIKISGKSQSKLNLTTFTDDFNRHKLPNQVDLKISFGQRQSLKQKISEGPYEIRI
jgi:hypothetical protein